MLTTCPIIAYNRVALSQSARTPEGPKKLKYVVGVKAWGSTDICRLGNKFSIIMQGCPCWCGYLGPLTRHALNGVGYKPIIAMLQQGLQWCPQENSSHKQYMGNKCLLIIWLISSMRAEASASASKMKPTGRHGMITENLSMSSLPSSQ
jgi:hypothetical protein